MDNSLGRITADLKFFFSGLECKDEIYSASQYAAVKAELAANNNNNCVKISSPSSLQIVPDIIVTVADDKTSKNNNKAINNKKEVPEVKQDRIQSVRKPVSSTAKLFGSVQKDPTERPQTNTSKIFGPRTRDMNKGFLMFSDEAPGQTSEFFYYFFLIIFFIIIIFIFFIIIFCSEFPFLMTQTIFPNSFYSATGKNFSRNVISIFYMV